MPPFFVRTTLVEIPSDPPGNLYVRLEIVLDNPKDEGLRKWAEKS